MTVIEVRGLTKRYQGHVGIDGISFEVGRGEIFGILGPNGAGKTTTVECLEGPRRRDAGTVTVLGLDPGRTACPPSADRRPAPGEPATGPDQGLGGPRSVRQRAGNFTPLGSALHAIGDSWMGMEPRTEYLVIMAVYAVVATTGAVIFFRWESS